jgi:hypothetical protein
MINTGIPCHRRMRQKSNDKMGHNSLGTAASMTMIGHYARTKRVDTSPQCGDDADVPSLGVAQVWAMLGRKIRLPPWHG